MTFQSAIHALFDFAFYYPLFMSYVWVTGAVYYFFYRERIERRPFYDPPTLSESIGVTFIVPCHNEGDNVRDTIVALLEQDYPKFEVIAINDASTDSRSPASAPSPRELASGAEMASAESTRTPG